MKVWPDEYIGEREDHEDERVTPSSWDRIPKSSLYGEAELTNETLLFAMAHIFNEMRNMTIQMNRIAAALEQANNLR